MQRPPVDPERTQPHRPVRPVMPDHTQPGRPIPPPTGLPRPPYPPPPPARKKKRRARRRGPSCLGCLLQGGLAAGLFLAAFTVLFAVIYILAPPPRMNILVLGIDARAGEGVVTRTDTVILSTVDPAQPYVGMLSIPRDLYLNIPGYGPQRINAAHVFAERDIPGSGPQKAMETVSANFGVPVHRYLRINFEGFIAIVNAAGGVTVDVERPFIDYAYPTPDYGTMVIEFQAGRQHLDGERALQYARSRHASNDADRARRQQQVIQGVMRQMLWPGNWWRAPGVFRAYVQHVDTDLTIIDVAALAPAVLWVGPDGIDSRVFDASLAYGRTTEGGASVLEPRWDAISLLMDEMFRR